MFSGRALGLLFLFVTSAAWIGASFITQALVAPSGEQDEAALEPWLLTLICSSTLILYLPIGHFARKRARYEGRGSRKSLRPRNRQRKGLIVATTGDVALESATGCMHPRRRATAAAASATENPAIEGEEYADADGALIPDTENVTSVGHGRGRHVRGLERQPLLHHPHRQQNSEDAVVLSGFTDSDDGGVDGTAPGSEVPDVGTGQIIQAAIVVAPVWFAAQLAFTASLSYTSVTSNTVLSSCSSLFVYLGSLALGQEMGSTLRLLCVAAAMAGTSMVALGDRRSDEAGSGVSGAAGGAASSSPLVGDALTLLAAALYAGYTLMMKRMLVKDDAAVMALFFGCIGLLYAAVLLPLAGGLAAMRAGVVTRVTGQSLGLALVQGLIDYVAADYAWARAVMLLGPTATSCGLAMQIPAAGLIDALLNGSHLSWKESPASLVQFSLGSALIICGFVGVSLEPHQLSAVLRKCGAGVCWGGGWGWGTARRVSKGGVGAGGEGSGVMAGPGVVEEMDRILVESTGWVAGGGGGEEAAGLLAVSRQGVAGGERVGSEGGGKGVESVGPRAGGKLEEEGGEEAGVKRAREGVSGGGAAAGAGVGGITRTSAGGSGGGAPLGRWQWMLGLGGGGGTSTADVSYIPLSSSAVPVVVAVGSGGASGSPSSRG